MSTVAIPAAPRLEDAEKRKSTDCIYYLASPLTCKKGNECEYRHSEAARTNPKDCRFWLASKCLNKSCPFRHPPLEESRAQAPQPTNGARSQTLCYFYGQGFCAKGDRCQFLHGRSVAPVPPSVLLAQKLAHTPTPPAKQAEPNTVKPQVTKPEAASVKKLQEADDASVRRTFEAEAALPKHQANINSFPKKPAGKQATVVKGRTDTQVRNGTQVQAHQVREPTVQSGIKNTMAVPKARTVVEEHERSPEHIHDSFDVLVDDDSEEDYRNFEVQRTLYRSGARFSRDSVRQSSYDGGYIDYDRPADEDNEDYRRNARSVSVTERLTYSSRESRSLDKSDLRNLLKRRRADAENTEPIDNVRRSRSRERTVINKQTKRPERPREVATGNGFHLPSYKSRTVKDISPPLYESRPNRFSDSNNFDAPKSLAEIVASKRRKSEPEAVPNAKKISSPRLGHSGENFEAPKPLQELLKTKCKAEAPEARTPPAVVLQEKRKEEFPEVKPACQTTTVEVVPVNQNLSVPNSDHVSIEQHISGDPMDVDYDEDDEFVKKLNSYFRR